jgi:hypothetical protein
MSVLCSSCGERSGIHSADEFPSVKLCYPCVRDFLESLYRMGVADGNPIVALYWYGVPSLTTHSDYETPAWSTVPLKGFKLIVCN